MADDRHHYPSTEPGDSEDIVLALERGQAFWSRGRNGEALAWLHSAASKAEAQGRAPRGAALKRVWQRLSAGSPSRAVEAPVPAATALVSEFDPDLDAEVTETTYADERDGAVARARTAVVARASPLQGHRVAVKSLPREPDALMVRVLKPGASVPAGMHEAVLVALDPGVDLFAPKP